jgi:hypothetical protein
LVISLVRFWPQAPAVGIEHQQTKPEAALAASGNYLRLPIDQDFPNSTEATATAQPEVNHFTRRKTWQQN